MFRANDFCFILSSTTKKARWRGVCPEVMGQIYLKFFYMLYER